MRFQGYICIYIYIAIATNGKRNGAIIEMKRGDKCCPPDVQKGFWATFSPLRIWRDRDLFVVLTFCEYNIKIIIKKDEAKANEIVNIK